jgi:hypothetical protein
MVEFFQLIVEKFFQLANLADAKDLKLVDFSEVHCGFCNSDLATRSRFVGKFQFGLE